MSALTAADAPYLVMMACFIAGTGLAVLCWGVGYALALGKAATRARQNVGIVLTAVGSLAFIAGMVGVRYSDGLAAAALSWVR